MHTLWFVGRDSKDHDYYIDTNYFSQPHVKHGHPYPRFLCVALSSPKVVQSPDQGAPLPWLVPETLRR